MKARTLPENLVYNSTTAGIVLLLNRAGLNTRKGRGVLVNASQASEKGALDNLIPPVGQRIADSNNLATGKLAA